jgi:hypothetical protein
MTTGLLIPTPAGNVHTNCDDVWLTRKQVAPPTVTVAVWPKLLPVRVMGVLPAVEAAVGEMVDDKDGAL